jgi:hypothetical protein
MSDPGDPLNLPIDDAPPIRIPAPPGGFPPSRKPKKSPQKGRRNSRLARLPVASLIRAGVVIVGAAIVVLVIVIVITAIHQH